MACVRFLLDKRNVSKDYIYSEKSGRVYLVLEPPNHPTLVKKISTNIQYRRSNISQIQ